MMVVADVVGWVGAGLVTATYAHLARHGSRPLHHVGNTLGGAGLAAAAVAHHTWSSVAENLMWVALACYGLWRGRPVSRAEQVELPLAELVEAVAAVASGARVGLAPPGAALPGSPPGGAVPALAGPALAGTVLAGTVLAGQAIGAQAAPGHAASDGQELTGANR